ncbi:hypothetical protein FALBO_13452 [Fusarium albosuccineum]|uniref:F-box domain-containing protein n=1 Tax=Fusarium albosuccineum TaxID=1237068 RepID=A0A8H4L280_9HYPO|nr:hypothetical protein FALBO_13452 [Fusarium albosuccineum]
MEEAGSQGLFVRVPNEIFQMIVASSNWASVHSLSRVNKGFRAHLIPLLFRKVCFRGTQVEVCWMLQWFLSVRTNKDIYFTIETATIAIPDWADNVTSEAITVLPPAEGSIAIKSLSVNIHEALYHMKKLRVLSLHLGHWYHWQSDMIVDHLKVFGYWPHLHSLRIEGPRDIGGKGSGRVKLFDWMLLQCDPHTITALHLEHREGYYSYDVAALYPNVERLHLRFNDAQASQPGWLTTLIDQPLIKIQEDFPGLKWLVLSERNVQPAGRLNALPIGEILFRLILRLCRDLGEFEHLERFAFPLNHRRLGPAVMADLFVGDGRMTQSPEYLSVWYGRVIQIVSMMCPNLMEICILDSYPVYYRGTRPAKGEIMTTERMALPRNSCWNQFPAGLVD